MTQAARSWLPEEAFTAARVSSVLQDMLDAWSKRFFKGSKVRVGEAAGNRLATGETIDIAGRHANLSISGPGKCHVLEAALDANLTGTDLGEADHRILAAFAEEMLQALVTTIDAGVEDAASTEGQARSFFLTLDGKMIGTIRMDDAVLAKSIRAQLPPMRREKPPLTARRASLKALPVTLSSVLGQAEVTLQEVKELACNDVLLLDKAVDALLELRIEGSDAVIARGKLIQNEGRNGLQLT